MQEIYQGKCLRENGEGAGEAGRGVPSQCRSNPFKREGKGGTLGRRVLSRHAVLKKCQKSNGEYSSQSYPSEESCIFLQEHPAYVSLLSSAMGCSSPWQEWPQLGSNGGFQWAAARMSVNYAPGIQRPETCTFVTTVGEIPINGILDFKGRTAFKAFEQY